MFAASKSWCQNVKKIQWNEKWAYNNEITTTTKIKLVFSSGARLLLLVGVTTEIFYNINYEVSKVKVSYKVNITRCYRNKPWETDSVQSCKLGMSHYLFHWFDKCVTKYHLKNICIIYLIKHIFSLLYI